MVVPSLKVTVLLGVPPYAPRMVAVNVTAFPLVDGLGVEVSVVVVDARLTVSDIAADVLPLKFGFPL
jgi:hypothetical protein